MSNIYAGVTMCVHPNMSICFQQICFYIFLVSAQGIVGIGAAVINAYVGDNNDLRVHFYKNTTMEDNIVRQRSWDRLQIQVGV